MEAWVWIILIVIFFIIVAVILYFVFRTDPNAPLASGKANGNGLVIPNANLNNSDGGSNWWIWIIAGIFIFIIIIVLVVAFWSGTTKEVVAPVMAAAPSITIMDNTPEPAYVPPMIQGASPSAIHFHEQIHFHGSGADDFDRGAVFNSNDVPVTMPARDGIDVLRKEAGSFPPEARNGPGRNGITNMRPQPQFSGQGRGATFDPDPQQRIYVRPGTAGRATVQNENGGIERGVLRTPPRVASTFVDPPARRVNIQG